MSKHSASKGSNRQGRSRSLFSFRHQNPVARLISTIAALAIALLVVGVNAAPVQAASPCPIPGGFEIDGDMTQNTCTPSGIDWGTPGLNVQATTQGGTYSTAGKDDSDPSTWVSSGSTPDKTNFERAYATSRTVDIGGGILHYFVDVAWERTDTAGTQGYAIEIDNSGSNVAADGTPQPNRSHGTAVVYISSQGSSAPTFDSACTFTSQSDYGDTCSSAANPNVVSAINTAIITDPLNSNTSQAAGSFFEVSIDVTGLTGIAPSCPGASANSVYLRSITGQTSNGNLKGYMAPLDVAPDSTCTTPTITTQTQANDPVDGVSGVVAPGTPQHDVATVTGTAAHPAPTGSVTFSLCGPTASATDCTTGGASGGTNPLTQHATNSTAQSDDLSPTDPGWYCWRAHFTPDPVNSGNPFLPATATTHTNECFHVVYANPTISTQIAVNGANAPGLGFTTLGDTATLHDFVPGSVTGDTIDFNLYDVTADPGCTGTPVFQTTGTLNAAGEATTIASYTPTAAHTFVWIATYPGDVLNHSRSGTCADANESATIVGAHIDVTKSANPPGPVSAGTDIGFDITVSNSGAVPAQGTTVTDVLPNTGDLHWSLNPTYSGCSIAAGTGANTGHQVLSCSLGTVGAGTIANPTTLPVIHVQSSTSPADCGTVSNTATVATTNGTGEDSDAAHVTVLCPGLGITKTADADSVNVGSPIGFTVTATNTGAGTASGVLVRDVLPTGPGITWTIDTTVHPATGPLSCSIDPGTGADAGHQVLTCTGSLGSGVSETVHVTSPTEWTVDGETVVNSCLGGTDNTGVYDNTAQVSASNVTASPTASAHEAVLCPALDVSKTADHAVVNAGEEIGFTVIASNTGPGTATGTLVDDPLPTGPGVTWTLVSKTGPLTCGIAGGTLTCTGTLAQGDIEVLHVTSPTEWTGSGETEVNSCQGGTEGSGVYDNTATLTSANAPGDSASASVTVLCPALTLAKVADAASVNAGQGIGFIVTASNSDAEGTGSALAAEINDPLPAGNGVSWSIASGPENCSITGSAPTQTLHCDAVTLGAGDSESVHVVSATTSTSCAAYPNTASLTATNAPTLTASASTSVVNCVIVSPPSPPKHPNVLPNTGGPDEWMLAAGLAFLLGGGALLMTDRRRRHRS